MPKRKLKESESFILSEDEISRLLENTKGRNKFILTALLYGGLRVGELVHMRRSWVHVDDKLSEEMGCDLIKIPIKGHKCNCVDCLYKEFIHKQKNKKSHDQQWYKDVQKEFYKLKSLNKLPPLNPYWTPNSEAGAREIPILFDIFKSELLSFFSKNKSLNISRQYVWLIVKNESKAILGDDRKLYPHAVRATCAKLWADVDLDINSIQQVMGWKTRTPAKCFTDTKSQNGLKNKKMRRRKIKR